MRHTIVSLIAAILIIAPASAAPVYVDRVVEWHTSTAGGVEHVMPPADCLVGPLPPYDLELLPLAEMNARWPTGNPALPNRLGMTLYPHSRANPGDIAIIYLAIDPPQATINEMKLHEEAHLRGCQHPGYRVHSDGTPVTAGQ